MRSIHSGAMVCIAAVWLSLLLSSPALAWGEGLRRTQGPDDPDDLQKVSLKAQQTNQVRDSDSNLPISRGGLGSIPVSTEGINHLSPSVKDSRLLSALKALASSRSPWDSGQSSRTFSNLLRPITGLSPLEPPTSAWQMGGENWISRMMGPAAHNHHNPQHKNDKISSTLDIPPPVVKQCPPQGLCDNAGNQGYLDAEDTQNTKTVPPSVADDSQQSSNLYVMNKLKIGGHFRTDQSRDSLRGLASMHRRTQKTHYEPSQVGSAMSRDGAFPSHEKFRSAHFPQGSPVSAPNITHLNIAQGSGNNHHHVAGAGATSTKTPDRGMNRWWSLLLQPGNEDRNEVEHVASPDWGINQDAASHGEKVRHGLPLRLMNALTPHNSDQLRHLLFNSAPPQNPDPQDKNSAESGFIIRSNPPYLTRAEPATRPDWVGLGQSVGQQNLPIDPPQQFKTLANALSKSRIEKRDVRQEEETQGAHLQSTRVDSAKPRPLSPYSAESSVNTSAVGDLEPKEAKVATTAENTTSLSDTELSYRFRGMVGLVDDSRLPIKHFDNTDILGSQHERSRSNPQLIPQVALANSTNENSRGSASTVNKAGNFSYYVPITEPINATKAAVGQPPEKATPVPSFSPNADSGDQGLINPAEPEEAEAEEHSPGETEPEAESEFDIDISIDPGSVEPEVETEPEPEAKAEDTPNMDPEAENTGDTVYPEGDPEDSDDGEYLEHVDTEPVDAEPEPEFEPTAEPESEVTDDNCLSECYAEPAPEWIIAKDTWKAAWEIHVYGLGIVFAVIALYSLISIIRLGTQRNLLSQGYFISLNAMLLLLCSTRAAMLMVDGYNSGGTFHPIVAYLLYTVGFPSITSAFSILFLALLKTMKMQLLSPRIQKPQVLLGMIILHFSISLGVDMILGYFYDSRVTSMVCQVMSLLWGVSLSVGYMYVFRKLFVSAVRRQKELQRVMSTMSKIGSTSVEPKQPKLMVSIAIKVTLVTAILGFILAGIHIYGMIDVSNVFTQDIPQPWPWWGLHFGLRLTELGMCVTMSYVATQPFRQPHASPEKTSNAFTQCWDVVYLVPCYRLCQFGDHQTKEVGHQLQMTTHQESLVQNHQAMGYSNVNLNQDPEDTTYEITETPALGDDRKHIIDNKLFGAVISYENEAPTTTNTATTATTTTTTPTDESQEPQQARRPNSMLIKEDGFIRFRQEWDPLGDPIGSTDDELNASSSIMLDNGYISTPNGDCIRSSADPGQYHKHFAKYYQAPRTRNGQLPQSCDKEGNVTDSEQYHSMSVPNTGANTPATPRSFCSTDGEVTSGVFNFRPPSSIHLRESIEGALDYSDLSLRSPDYFGTQDSFTLPKTPEELDEGQGFPLDKPRKRKFSEADIPFGSRLRRASSRASKRSCHSDLKTPDLPWVHKSPQQYWDKVKAKGSSVSLNLATPYGSGYSPLEDGEEQYTVAEVRNYLMRSSLYRSNSDSLTHIKYENHEHGTDV